ncbi:MerR family transcriptional regulator [Amycolatopsis sp. 195334CR]|uniref:MerR family transcriptional regulator n=1 Tax=Amycolatopsis sp. 195334CR TaxID=2814588 RepID=UPI001A8DA3A4|nr:MerR family transcriptional regulator [Amycolatopsis sp. 195334CR]MBN6038171.1 MerR family transcriptional regulator [Amycolatopsis sp. 195334CR]
MAWSTRQIAELAGTSLRAVRHYHEVGLLAEPERRANGYKSYGVAHLVRLLRIKRLADLGFSLTQIAEMGDADEHPGEALRVLDSELATTIERLKRARLELAMILRESVPTDLPPEIASVAADAKLTEADRSFVVVMSRVFGPSAMDAYRDLMRRTADYGTGAEFDHLPADADAETRRALAEAMAPKVRALLGEYPDLVDPGTSTPKGVRQAAKTIDLALTDLYNPAQVDVIHRLRRLLAEESR